MATQKEERQSQRDEQIENPKEAHIESEIKLSVSSTSGTSSTTTSEHDHYEHVHIHGVSSKGHHIVAHHADDGSGDRAEGCHATSQADHFRCVH